MSILIETCLGDITIDLDIANSPKLCHNILKLAKARYYTNTLIYNVQQGRFCQMGDPRGDGNGGCSIYGLIDTLESMKEEKDDLLSRLIHVERSQKRFMKSSGRILSKEELKQKGHVVATEMGGVKNTIGSQFLITIDEGPNRALDGITHDHHHSNDHNDNSVDDDRHGLLLDDKKYYSIGKVVEDENDVLAKINALYCDKGGRPYTDVRIIRMYILDDPFDEWNSDDDNESTNKNSLLKKRDMEMVLKKRHIQLMKEEDLPKEHIACARWISSSSPTYDKPKEEIVEERISYNEAMIDQGDEEAQRKKREEALKKEDKSNAAILEMLGDIASVDMKPPENVLFVCKLNPSTEDDDLQLIFSRFDQNAKAEIIRDPDTGDSLQYAFIEFETKEACNEAYFKMNNALIDDRRIKVDFSQSVAKEWNRYTLSKTGRGQRGRGRGRGNFHNPGGSSAWANYKDDRLSSQSNKEKKYYGGYRQINHHASRNEGRLHERETAYHRHDSAGANMRNSYEGSDDGDNGSDSTSEDCSVNHRRDRKKYSRRKDGHRRRSKEYKRRSKHRRSERENKDSEDDDDSQASKEYRQHKKRKHKHHKHQSRRRQNEDDERRKGDRRSDKKRRKYSSRRSRSRSLEKMYG